MWTDQSLQDAMKLLLDANTVAKVSTDESTYVVADEIPYSEELYLEALQKLVQDGKLKQSAKSEERATFERVQ